MIIGIDHVQLAMPRGEESRAREFYAGVLGMKEVPKPQQLQANGGCWFVSGDAHIHLGAADPFPACKAHPALLVNDLEALLGRLADAGVAFAPGKPLEGFSRGDIADPFGNRIELMQRI